MKLVESKKPKVTSFNASLPIQSKTINNPGNDKFNASKNKSKKTWTISTMPEEEKKKKNIMHSASYSVAAVVAVASPGPEQPRPG